MTEGRQVAAVQLSGTTAFGSLLDGKGGLAGACAGDGIRCYRLRRFIETQLLAASGQSLRYCERSANRSANRAGTTQILTYIHQLMNDSESAKNASEIEGVQRIEPAPPRRGV
jgi:hypothetical protein